MMSDGIGTMKRLIDVDADQQLDEHEQPTTSEPSPSAAGA